MSLKSFLKRRNSKKPICLLILIDDDLQMIWYDSEELNNIEEKYLKMEVMDYTREYDCTEIWLK